MSDPLAEFLDDRERAAAADDPCASLCWLASVDEHGAPQVRTIVLRLVEQRPALFFNATSPKQRQLNNGRAAICTYFASLQVQYRMNCAIEPMPETLVHQSWQARPLAPQRLDWYYALNRVQSSAVADRQTLLDELNALDVAGPMSAPSSAVGYWLTPAEIERLDLSQPNGVHDRRHWRYEEGTWQLRTLVP